MTDGVQLYPGVVIVNEKAFMESHQATVERNAGNFYFTPYAERLKDYEAIKSKHENKR